MLLNGFLYLCCGWFDSSSGTKSYKTVKEEKEEGFVANKTAQHKSPSFVSMNLFEYLLTLVIVFGVAFAAWYFLINKANS